MSYTIKISYQALMKKTKLVSPTFSELKAKTENFFPQLKGTLYFIQYLDESDYVLISDDADVETMLAEPSACYKLSISNELSSGKFPPSDISCLEDSVQILPSKSEEIISGYPALNNMNTQQGIIPIPDDEEVKQDNQAPALKKGKKEKVKLAPEARKLVKLAKKINKKKVEDQKSKDDFLHEFQANPEAAKMKPKKRACLLKAKKSLTPLSQEESQELDEIISKHEVKKCKKQEDKKEKKELIEDIKNVMSGKSTKDPKDVVSKVIERLQQHPNLFKKKPKLRCEVLKIKKTQTSLSEAEESELATLQKKQEKKKDNKKILKPTESNKNLKKKTNKKLEGCKFPKVAIALLKLKKKNIPLNEEVKNKLNNILTTNPLAFKKFPRVRKAFLEYKKSVMNLTAEESAELAAPIKKGDKKQKDSHKIEKIVEKQVNKKMKTLFPKIVAQLTKKMVGLAEKIPFPVAGNENNSQFDGKMIKEINRYPEHPTYSDTLIYHTVMVRNTGKIAWDTNCSIGTHGAQLYPLPGLKVGEETIVTFAVPNMKCPEYESKVSFFRNSKVFGKEFKVKVTNSVPKGSKIHPEIKSSFPIWIEKKADQLISLFNTNKQKTLEFVDKNKFLQTEDMIDRLLSNPEEMKNLF